MSDQLISADVIRMVYKIIHDIKIGNTRMVAYRTTEDNLQNPWLGQPEPIELLIVNEQTGKLLQYTDVVVKTSLMGGLDDVWCKNYKNLLFIYCTNEFHIVDLDRVEKIKTYSAVENCITFNNGEIVAIIFQSDIIFYSVLENKETDISKPLQIEGNTVYEDYTKILNNNCILIDNGVDDRIYSLTEHKMLHMDKRITNTYLISNDDIIFHTLDTYGRPQGITIYNLNKFEEVYHVDCYNTCYIPLNTKSIGIQTPDKLLMYSILDRKIVKEIEISGAQQFYEEWGRSLTFISFGKTWMLFDRNNNKIVNIFNSDTNTIAIRSIKSYCDLIVIDTKNKSNTFDLIDYRCENVFDYSHKGNYYIHNDKVFTLDEFLEHFTIKEIIPKYNKNGTVGYYNVVNSKGLTGKLSSKFNKLRFKDVLHNKNILTDRFEYIKKKYLV